MSTRLHDHNGLRTELQAAADIGVSTLKETLMIPAYEYQFGVKISDGGVANNGQFISDEEARRHGSKMGNPDWQIAYPSGDVFSKEAMVHSQVFKKYSFKESKLRNMLARKTPILVLREKYVDEISVATLKLLLDDDGVYTEYLPSSYGGGPGRVLYDFQVEEFFKDGKFERTVWSEETLKIIPVAAFAPRRMRD